MTSVILSSYFDPDKTDGFTNQLNSALSVESIALAQVLTHPHSFFNIREPDNQIMIKYNVYRRRWRRVVYFSWTLLSIFVGSSPEKKYGRFKLKNGLVIYSEEVDMEAAFNEKVLNYYYDESRKQQVNPADIEMDLDVEYGDEKVAMKSADGTVFDYAVTKVFTIKPGYYGICQNLLDAINIALDGFLSVSNDIGYRLPYKWPDAMYPHHMRWFGKDYDPEVDSLSRFKAWHAAKGRVAGFTMADDGRPCFVVDGGFANWCHLQIRLPKAVQYLLGYTYDVSMDIGWHSIYPVIPLQPFVVAIGKKATILTPAEKLMQSRPPLERPFVQFWMFGMVGHVDTLPKPPITVKVITTNPPELKRLKDWPSESPTLNIGLWNARQPADMTRMTINSLWVYCDAIQSNFVNGVMEPLLRVIPYDRSGLNVGCHIVGNLHHCTVSRDAIKSIKVWFKDEPWKQDHLHIHGHVIIKLDCQTG